MPADDFILPNFIVADMYRSSLVNIPDFSTETFAPELLPVTTTKANQSLRFLGQNDKHIVVLVSDKEAPVISDDVLQFLVKILQACQLDLNDIAIINSYTQVITYEQLKDQLAPYCIFMFDVDPAMVKLPFIIPHFQVQEFAGCSFVTAPALKPMMDKTPESKALKTKLWTTLQKVFKL